MAEEPKPTEASEGAGKNAAAEQDVQDVLSELKGDEKADTSAATEQKDEKANGDKATATENAEADAEAKEEARIIAEATKLGEKAADKDRSKDPRGQRPGARGGRGGRRVNHRDNIKSDFSSLKESSDPDEIRKQVEFYFSDSNLPTDKFLLSKVGGCENRPVELSIIHSFKRMRHFQPFSAIVAALKDSETLNVTNDDTCVQRKTPLPENFSESPDSNAVKVFEDKAMHRSIYAKGFGKEEPSTQFDIEAFFTPYGPLNAVRLRRTPDKIFKGSVFVEFDSEEGQKKFLEMDPKPKWKGTTELLVKSKKDYCEEKVKEIEAGRLKPRDGRYNSRGRGGRGGRNRGNDRDWKDRRADDQKTGFRGRGGHRGGRGDRSEEKKPEEQQVEKDSRGVPIVHTSTSVPKEKNQEESDAQAGQKRAREDETPADTNGAADTSRPAKKVDVKEG